MACASVLLPGGTCAVCPSSWVQQAVWWTGPARQVGSRAGRAQCVVPPGRQLTVQVQGRLHHARLTWKTFALRTSRAWGSVGHAPVLLPRVPHDPPPRHQNGTGSPGLQLGRQRIILLTLIGVITMALEHRQNQPSGVLR